MLFLLKFVIIILSYTYKYFYIFTKKEMPVFADALPMPGDLPINAIDPTSFSPLWILGMIPTSRWIIYSLLILFSIVCVWIIFKKANRKWWESIIPFWNSYITFKIAWKKNRFWFLIIPWIVQFITTYICNLLWISWWTIESVIILLCWLVALVGIVLYLIMFFKLSKKFWKSEWFGVWLLFLTPIFLWILAFWKAEYLGENNQQ